MNNIEIRAINDSLRADGNGGLTGYAAVFGAEFDSGSFIETIKPGAFTRALKEKHDVRMLVNHSPDLVLGRTKSGTLALAQDNKGLKVDCDLPDTQAAQDVRKLIKRGDISGMSFAFVIRKEKWPDRDHREIIDLDLFDVSVVTYPAYKDTTVTARELAAAGVECRSVGFYRPRLEKCERIEPGTLPDLAMERERLSLRLRLLKLIES